MSGSGSATEGASLRFPAVGTTPLAAFSERLFRSLRRADQRRWAHIYLAGLLHTEGKKSMRRLAHTVSPARPNTAQSLRQFISSSSWESEPVLHELTRWAEEHKVAAAWTVSRLLIPKSGNRSAGVHRYFDPESSRTLNCQLCVGAFLCIGTTHIPVTWELHLPTAWTEDPELRHLARIPDCVQYRPLWVQVLDLVDTLTSRAGGQTVPVVADLSSATHVLSFLTLLRQRGLDCVISLPPTTHVQLLDESGPFGPPLASAQECVSSPRPVESVLVSSAHRAPRRAHVRSAVVRLPRDRAPGSTGAPYRVFGEVTRDDRPGPVWITNLSDLPLDDVMSLATLHESTSASVATMKRDLGLGDFEGRSFPGWHHHMTMVSSAYAYRSLTSP